MSLSVAAADPPFKAKLQTFLGSCWAQDWSPRRKSWELLAMIPASKGNEGGHW